MRFVDSAGLFGTSGVSTTSKFKCELCGRVYNEEDDETSDDFIRNTEFLGKTVAECCFERIEDEILYRMPSILPWFQKVLARRHERLAQLEEGLQQVTATLVKSSQKLEL
jgi:rubredoxin